VATTKPLSPTELRARLLELRDLASQYAALESTIEAKAGELENSDWEFSDERGARFVNAIGGELKGVYWRARTPQERESDTDAFDLCQAVQDALEVLDFAMQRNHEGGESDAS
jgi:hypothetical protein